MLGEVIMDHLRVALPLGIGDAMWVCQKLKGLSAYHDGRPIRAFINSSPNHATVGFLNIVPSVDEAIFSREAPYDINTEMPPSYLHEKWSTLNGCAGWRNFDYVLVANGHLESRKRIETWLPEIETEFSFELNIKQEDRDYAAEISGPRPVLLYLSGVGPNMGFHANTWSVDYWVVLVEMLNAAGIEPVLVGAKTHDDLLYGMEFEKRAVRLKYNSTIGKTNIPQYCAQIEEAAVWCGLNSGGGIVAAMRKTPTVMLWSDDRFPIRGVPTFLPHEMKTSWLNEDQLTTYRTLSYGSPDLSPTKVIESILEVIR